MQVIAELNEQSYLATWTRQEPSIGRQRVEGAEENAGRCTRITDEGIDGTMRSVFSLPRGHESPIGLAPWSGDSR